MRTFQQTDASGKPGRAWNIEINVRAVKRVLEIAKINLADMLFATGEPLAGRLDDPGVLAGVLWALCGEQAEAAKITEDDFYRLLDGPTLGTAGTAFWEEVGDFFHGADLGMGRRIAWTIRETLRLMAEAKRKAECEAESPVSTDSGTPPVSEAGITTASGKSPGSSA